MELFEVSALLLHRGCRLRSLFHPNCGIWADGGFAGGIGCHAIDWANRNCSLGYRVDATHQGKGTATKCCASMLHYLFEELGLAPGGNSVRRWGSRPILDPKTLVTREEILESFVVVG